MPAGQGERAAGEAGACGSGDRKGDTEEAALKEAKSTRFGDQLSLRVKESGENVKNMYLSSKSSTDKCQWGKKPNL